MSWSIWRVSPGLRCTVRSRSRSVMRSAPGGCRAAPPCRPPAAWPRPWGLARRRRGGLPAARREGYLASHAGATPRSPSVPAAHGTPPLPAATRPDRLCHCKADGPVPRAAWLRALRRCWPTRPTGSGYLAAAAPRSCTGDRRPSTRAWHIGQAGPIVISTGYAQGIALLVGPLAEPGASAWPWRTRRRATTRWPRTHGRVGGRGVPVDEDGIRVDRSTAPDADAVVLTSSHQLPTGGAPADRRARRCAGPGSGGIVIEDDYDAEYRYDRQPVGAMQGWPRSGWSTRGLPARAWRPGCGSAGWPAAALVEP